MNSKLLSSLLTICCAASAVLAQPSKPLSPLDGVEVLRGWVDVETEGEIVTVHAGGLDGSLDRVFKVEVEDQAELPVSLRSDFAQVFYWRGNLAVLATREGKALHFSIPGFEAPPGPATGRLVPGADLDSLLARYELTEVATATAILSGRVPGCSWTPSGASRGAAPRSSTTTRLLQPVAAEWGRVAALAASPAGMARPARSPVVSVAAPPAPARFCVSALKA